MRTRLQLFLVFLLILGGCDRIDNPVSLKSFVHGHVYDAASHHPIEGAQIEVGRHRATSSGDGRYTVMEVGSGSFVVRASKAGYLPYEAPVDVNLLAVEKNIYLEKR